MSYCNRYSEGIKRVLKTFGPTPEFAGATVKKIHQVCDTVPRAMIADNAGEVTFVSSVPFSYVLLPLFSEDPRVARQTG